MKHPASLSGIELGLSSPPWGALRITGNPSPWIYSTYSDSLGWAEQRLASATTTKMIFTMAVVCYSCEYDASIRVINFVIIKPHPSFAGRSLLLSLCVSMCLCGKSFKNCWADRLHYDPGEETIRLWKTSPWGKDGWGWIRLIVGFQPLMVISPTARWMQVYARWFNVDLSCLGRTIYARQLWRHGG